MCAALGGEVFGAFVSDWRVAAGVAGRYMGVAQN